MSEVATKKKELSAVAEVRISAKVSGTLFTPFQQVGVTIKDAVVSEDSARDNILAVAHEALMRQGKEWFIGLLKKDSDLKRRVGGTRWEVTIRHIDYRFE